MKYLTFIMKTVLLSLFSLSCLFVNAQNEFIHTSGKYILGPCQDTILLRGVNYSPYNWGYTLSDIKFDEIAKSGANSVRIPWYYDNPNAAIYADFVALDSAISRCVQHKMIAILELHDYTCGADTLALSLGSNWWKSTSVLPILMKYKHSIIVNIANEALQVNWQNNKVAALANYKSVYQNIIKSLRAVNGFDFPIMIDAPDCGQSSDVFVNNNTGLDLINADPKRNLIFSAHAYWYGYAGNDSAQMATKINNVVAANIPFVLGEIANEQDDATPCAYTLNYKPLLNYCQSQKIGWLAWIWDHDICPNRQLSSTGNFANLTAYGNDIINNPNYGLLAKAAAKSEYLVKGKCSNPNGIWEHNDNTKAGIYPNPGNGLFYLYNAPNMVAIHVFDAIGKNVSFEFLGQSLLKVNAAPGVYFVSISSKNSLTQTIKLVIN